MDLSLRVVQLQLLHQVLRAEVQLVDLVRHVQTLGHAFQLHLHEVVVIGMAADVEVAGHLFDGEGTHQSAPVLVPECLPHHLHLPHRVLLPEQLKGALVEVVALLVEPPFLDRTDIGVVRDHDVLEVEGDDLAGEGGELDVEVDAI